MTKQTSFIRLTPVLADHSPDLHVHLVVDGVAELNVLIVDSVTTVRQSARLK